MKKIYITLFVFVMGFTMVNAQNKDTKKADKHFDRLEFVDAIEDYEKLVEKGKADAYVYKRLAEANYKVYNTRDAERYYKMYLDNTENPDAEIYFKYAQSLMANSKFEDSKKAMMTFADQKPNDQRAKAFKANPNYISDLMMMDPKFDVQQMELNSEYSDFGAYEFDGTLYFVSARNKSRRKYGWNEQPTLDVFVAENVGGTFKNVEELPGDVNSKFHEGTIAITDDGQTMYFTRNDYLGGDYEKDAEGINRLKIYKADLVNGEWQDIESLPFNDTEYSNSHPALSPDGKTLYFSSDMSGGFGDSDIYKVSINDDGSYGDPENLGATINTEARESFPFVDNEGVLYFSSDGHLGMGGLDVFYANPDGNGFEYPKNLGKPLNSTSDDFGFTYNVAVESGYVSSNRGDNPKNDNIYNADLIRPIQETEVIVTVLNSESKEPLVNAEILIYDEDDNEVASISTDGQGKAKEVLLSNMEYDFQANLEDFDSSSQVVEASGDEMMVTMMLDPEPEIIRERSVSIEESILFEFDKAEIRSEAALELDKIVETMKKYSDIVVKVESHTDRRGPEEYNMNLSERRAQNTVDYIVSKGIDESRISGEGKGESELLNDCGSNCTEDDHRQNRRSEFMIVE